MLKSILVAVLIVGGFAGEAMAREYGPLRVKILFLSSGVGFTQVQINEKAKCETGSPDNLILPSTSDNHDAIFSVMMLAFTYDSSVEFTYKCDGVGMGTITRARMGR